MIMPIVILKAAYEKVLSISYQYALNTVLFEITDL